MHPRSTLADAKNETLSDIASVINLPTTDVRWLRTLNQCQQRLLETGDLFWGSHGRYLFCATDGCLTWPRAIAAIEAVSVCHEPITIRNSWYEFLDAMVGTCGCAPNLLERGVAPAFNDILGINKKIRVYADVAESATAKILLQGYDASNQWIYTETSPGSGVWVEGEYVTISTTPTLSTKLFTSLTAVQKPITNGVVRLYEYDTTLTTQRALAIYEPDETRPSYRRSLIPGISATGGDCASQAVTVEAKHAFIPARVDTDWLLIGNLMALELGCKALKMEKAERWTDAEVYWAKARKVLQDELRHHLGHGIVQPIRTPHKSIWGPAVQNIVG